MSQTYAINDPQPEDETMSEVMDDVLAPDGARVFGLGAPNLSNEEALFHLVTLLSRPRTTPHVFVYGVCFDKFRNVDLREGYRALLRTDESVRERWSATARRFADRYPKAAEKMLDSLRSVQATATKEDQSSLEARIRARIEAISPLVAARRELNAELQMRLFVLRNAVLGIKTSTKRPIIKSRYDLNSEFLGIMADLAHDAGVRLLLYINPLNPLAENPYVPQQYAEFKQWLGRFSEEKHVPLANLQDLVPEQHWGEFMGGPDFKHFRGEGHRLTARALVEQVRPILRVATAKGEL